MEYGLIGERLSHSFSEEVHNQMGAYSYTLKELTPTEVELFVKEKAFKGVNVTIPYKELVIPYLDYIDDAASEIGAVNTIVNKNGKLYGYNTDFFGMVALIERCKLNLKGKTVLVLGSGGTSKTAMAVAGRLGAKEIVVVSRRGNEGTVSYKDACKNYSHGEIIINTTPCGMYPNLEEMPIDLGRFPKLEGVIDAIYNPLNSRLVVEGRKRGVIACGGLYMLVAQAALACGKFTEKEIPKEKIDSVYNIIKREKQNVVLVGMAGCGKTTIGKALSARLSRKFIDTDFEIEKKTGETIPEIFLKYGEDGFREIEEQIVASLGDKQGCVIATGGGAVLREENILSLRQNGKIVFIDRPLEMLPATEDRPLSSNRELLEKRYRERYEIYFSVADVRVEAGLDLEKNISAVREAFLDENSCN